jgi:hypothetical protein
MGRGGKPDIDAFDSVTLLRAVNNRQAVLDKSIRLDWNSAIKEADPSLIHANDIVAAEYCSESGYPMVYDDHEYWSMQRIVYENWPLWKKIAIRPFLKAIPKWEKKLLSKHVTLTVSEGIAEEHRRICDHVFVLHNYNILAEMKDLPLDTERSGIAYVGNDYARKRFAPHRDMTGLKDHLEFDALHGLPRHELYLKLLTYNFGLLPFRHTYYSKYIGSSKVYDYLSCGLQVMMTRSLYDAFRQLPYTHPFDDYKDLKAAIGSVPDVSPREIMEFSRNNLVWECQKDTLFEAYELCIELHK